MDGWLDIGWEWMDNCFCASLHLPVPTASTYLLLFSSRFPFPSLPSPPQGPLSSLPRDVAPTVMYYAPALPIGYVQSNQTTVLPLSLSLRVERSTQAVTAAGN